MSRHSTFIELSETDRIELERRVAARTTSSRDLLRARVVLLAAGGRNNKEIAKEMGTHRHTARFWRNRFSQGGLAALEGDAPGRGRKRCLSEARLERILTGSVKPPPHRTRWSCRTMAREAGVSKNTVQRLWSVNGIRPHLMRTFKLSRDPHFEAKFWDVIGLYLNPPDKALVFCCDEKSQCQALERTQPGLPLGMGHIRTQTHDYHRHGTLTLFAALNYLDGKLISTIAQKHRHTQWLTFLKQIDHDTPPELDLHLIVDNYSTHKHAAVCRWIAKHPRFHLHFTPTSASWMNLVERFFRDITTDLIREGSFSSVAELRRSIYGYLEQRNACPVRYRWKAKGEDILRKIHKARQIIKV